MTVTLGSTTLVHGQERYQNGNATGPDNLRMSLTPGVSMREYVGANRVQGEHVTCDRGTVTFDVSRTFASVADALAYVRGNFLGEDSEGALKFDNDTVFAQAAVTGRAVAVVGRTVAVSYTIEG